MAAYEKQILDLVEQEGRGGEPFYLDFSKPSHRQCFYERYGGEEVLREEFPELYRLVQETAEASMNKSRETVKGAPLSEERGSLVDGVKIRELVCTGEAAGASGLVSLCQKSPRVYLSISVLKNGTVVKRSRQFYHNESNARLSCVDETLKSDPGDVLECVLNATWQDEATNLLKDCSRTLHARISEEETVQSVEIHHPCLYHPCINPIDVKNPMPHLSMIEMDATEKQPLEPAEKTDDPTLRTSINVCYARTPGGRDVSDYVYPEGRINKLQKVYLDFRGEVTLNKEAGYTFQSVESFDIVLDCGGDGLIFHQSTPKKDVHYYETEKGFAFVLPTYWGDVIPDSVMYGNRLYYLEAEICFKVKELEELQYVEVSSEVGMSLRDTHYTHIKPIRLFWGCLAEGTMIRMADGSEKAIEQMCCDNTVLTPSGPAAVVNVIRGQDSEVYAIQGKGCHAVYASGAHPFRTRNGWKAAREITAWDELAVENGFVEVEHHYLTQKPAAVYNLVLEGEHSFYAEGYLTGDNEVQGICQRKPLRESKTDPIVEEECRKLNCMFG